MIDDNRLCHAVCVESIVYGHLSVNAGTNICCVVSMAYELLVTSVVLARPNVFIDVNSLVCPYESHLEGRWNIPHVMTKDPTKYPIKVLSEHWLRLGI
jgi:hypothetical protein